MHAALANMIDVLTPVALEEQVFKARSHDLGFSRLFGGQVLGQSLVAAQRTVDADQAAHSLHGYFLRPGDPQQDVYYEVELVRSGKSVSTRWVLAKQNGLTIFSVVASFHRPESGFEHQHTMPDVKGPDGLVNELDLWRPYYHLLPDERRAKLTAPRAIETRPVEAYDPAKPKARPPQQSFWFKAVDRLPDDPLIHQALLAYASDFGLSLTALLPHAVTTLTPGLQVASMDHAMWFHRAGRVDEWLLYAMDSPAAGGARGFSRGQIFTQDGVLLASVAQEGLMRQRAPKP